MTRDTFDDRDNGSVDVHDIRFNPPPATLGAAQELLAHVPPPEEVPDDADDMLVVSSIRITVGQLAALKAYAEEHGTTQSQLIRGWIDLHLRAGDRRISLADAVRALNGLPTVA